MNVSVIGLGVRIMVYLQTFVFVNISHALSSFSDAHRNIMHLGLLSLRAENFAKLSGLFYTLFASNTAMVVTIRIMAFKQNPEISLQE